MVPYLPTWCLFDVRGTENVNNIPNKNKQNKKRAVDTRQSAQIAQLVRAVASLKKKPKTPGKQKTAGGSSGASHPLYQQVRALVNPFDSTPGVAKHLVDPLPSQAYKLKARTTLSVANGHNFIGLISPCFADGGVPTDFPSAIFISGAGSSYAKTIFSDTTEVGTLAYKGANTYATIAPIRPHKADPGSSFRLVSYAVRVRYTGTALNANGTLKYLPNDLSAMPFGDGTTYQNILDYVNGSNHTIMRSIYDRAVYDFNGLGATDWMHDDEVYPAVHDEGTGNSTTGQSTVNNWYPMTIGQNSSGVSFGTPGMVLTYTNNTNTSVQFEIELVENWEARTRTNTAFQTDSHGNPEVSQEVFRTVVSGHMHAASSSATTVNSSLKAVNAASKSPLGKLVIAAALA